MPSSDDMEEMPVGWNRTAISRKTLINVFFSVPQTKNLGGRNRSLEMKNVLI